MYQVTNKVIRLVNDTLLIGMLTMDDEEPNPDLILIGDPTEILFDESNNMHMKNWMPASRNCLVSRPANMIIAVSDPDKSTLKKFNEVVCNLEEIKADIEKNSGDNSESSMH